MALGDFMFFAVSAVDFALFIKDIKSPQVVNRPNEEYKPCFIKDTQEDKKTITPPFKTSYQRKMEYEEAVRTAQAIKKAEEEKQHPLEKWVVENSDYLLEILETGGLIPNSKISIDKKLLAEFLFKQKDIESVDITDEGLLLVRR